MVKRFRFIFAILITGFILSVVIPFLLPEEYTSTCSMLPSGNRKAGKLSAALNMMNINMPSEINSESSALFPAILNSRRIREALLERKILTKNGNRSIRELLEEKSLEESLEKLEDIVSIRQDEKNGMIRVSSTTGDPSLSKGITENLVELLREFNRVKRKTKARHHYNFIRYGLDKAREEMRRAEAALVDFEKKHRHYMESTNPDVLMKHSRLERRLKIKTEVFIDMAREKEIAGIELKRKSPIVKILDRAEKPTLKSGPPRKVVALLGGIFTIFFAFMVPVAREIPLSVIIRKLFLEEDADGIPEAEERTGRSAPSDISSEESDEKIHVPR